jgi:hypothetical protein
MFKGILFGKPWQSCGLRSNGDRAILWNGNITWLSAKEFEAFKESSGE